MSIMTVSAEGFSQMVKLNEAFPTVAKKYEGTAIFAPTQMELAKSIGLHSSQLYKGPKQKFPWLLENLTGLKEVHRGIVLGDVAMVSSVSVEDLPPVVDEPLVSELEESINQLPEATRLTLLDRLTKNS